MFFHPDDHYGVSQVRALRLFKRNGEETGDKYYSVIMKNPLQFRLVVDYIAAGLSFRQVETVINKTRKHPSLSSIGAVSDGEVANYARVVCAINLQALFSILNTNAI